MSLINHCHRLNSNLLLLFTPDHDSMATTHISNPDEFTTYACESLIVKAGNDFRFKIIIPDNKSFRIQWEFTVFYVRKKGKNSAPPSSTTADIGFSIIENLSNGSLPQLISYRYVRKYAFVRVCIYVCTYVCMYMFLNFI